ncbi:hypothetical protein [Prevotella intermedia]|uniref:Uncharacterized protein n=1 Tax=Prevotella intermedia TaxID=28131 RepID=A0A2M8M991_PREIN|nr:hypothetical protein [Prevotella intermedia]PJF00760.1 hypothetical protein CUB97_05555 [Prevotella intermedia]
MEKKVYVTPNTKKNRLAIENLMLTASPGVDGEYDPTLPIDSKEFEFFDEEGSKMGAKDANQSHWDY